MLKNYLKIAWRNLLKGRLYSFINIFGLGIGAAIAILFLSFTRDEWSFDKFHQNSDRIYRAWVKEHYRGDIFFNTITPYLLGSEIVDNFPEIEGMLRYTTINTMVKIGSDVQQETIHLAEPSFLELFDFEILNGSPAPLQHPNQVVITPEISEKYFGTSQSLNRTLTLQLAGEWKDFTVSGIVENSPPNSSIQYDILIPFENTKNYISEPGRNCWTCVMVETYVLLQEGTDVEELTSKVAPFIDDKVAKQYDPGQYVIGFQELSDIHLNNEYPVGLVQINDGRYPYILSGIALLILILASINFTMLSIGRSISRRKEVGIRKVTGATRFQLMNQFWSEAVITVLLSVIFGLVLSKALLPFFNQLADKQLTIEPNLFLLGSLAGLTLLTGLMAGIYPALVLSGFKPIHALQGSLDKISHDKGLILKSLVGFQFGLSIILIISSLIMQNQMQFLQNKNLGYQSDYVVTFPFQLSGVGLATNFEQGQLAFDRLKSELAGESDILDMTLTSHTFGTLGWSRLGYTDEESDKFRKFMFQKIDDRYLDMMDIPLKEGRNFSEEMGSDNRSAIINPAMAAEFGMEEPLGTFLPGPFRDFQVVGVTDEFHFASLHEPIAPLVMAVNGAEFIGAAPDMAFTDPPTPKISIKVTSDNLTQSLNKIKKNWGEVAPEQPFNYSFIDDNIDQQYRKETRLSQILGLGTIIAILIACLGLFGISSLTIAYRMKEIGIRKVLGATSAGIVRLVAQDFLRLVLIAIVIASPIAWWMMNQWLQDFAYNVGIDWWVFALAFSLALLLAFATISTQSLKAAWTNPVKTLRNE